MRKHLYLLVTFVSLVVAGCNENQSLVGTYKFYQDVEATGTYLDLRIDSTYVLYFTSQYDSIQLVLHTSDIDVWEVKDDSLFLHSARTNTHEILHLDNSTIYDKTNQGIYVRIPYDKMIDELSNIQKDWNGPRDY